jgi:hypothetical protein
MSYPTSKMWRSSTAGLKPLLVIGSGQTRIPLPGHNVHLIWDLVWAVGTKRRKSNYRLKLNMRLSPCGASRNVHNHARSQVLFAIREQRYPSFRFQTLWDHNLALRSLSLLRHVWRN